MLIIHLKRFKSEGRWKSKRQTLVNYPLEGLDLREYVKGPRKQPPYKLIAVTNHQGASTDSGHYTAFCKRASNWIKWVSQKLSSNVNENSKKSLEIRHIFRRSVKISSELLTATFQLVGHLGSYPQLVIFYFILQNLKTKILGPNSSRWVQHFYDKCNSWFLLFINSNKLAVPKA